jgi:hypothetical protein
MEVIKSTNGWLTFDENPGSVSAEINTFLTKIGAVRLLSFFGVVRLF